MLDADQRIPGCTHTDEFIQLHLDRRAMAILRILDQKDHQEGDDGRTSVDDQLPRVGKLEQRAANTPDDNNPGRKHKGRRTTRRQGCLISQIAEEFRDVGSFVKFLLLTSAQPH